MGFFLKALGAMVVADAIDRSARGPARYWYPNQPGLPRTGTQQPFVVGQCAAPPAGWYGDPCGRPFWRWWDGHQWTVHTGGANTRTTR